MNLQKTRVLVTGGSDGYGRGIAEVLRNAGADVWITGRTPGKLTRTADELGVHPVQADAASAADWDRVMATVGALDILVNNAGSGGHIAPLAQQSDAEIIATINANLTGAILGCRRAAKLMTERRRGVIVNVSSVCALYAWPAWSVYTAAKAGLSKFSHALYTELRPFGVKVTCVTPSWGQTSFNVAANISGAAENADLRSKCISPTELGGIVRGIIELPDHLAVPDITVQPMIQDISPM